MLLVRVLAIIVIIVVSVILIIIITVIIVTVIIEVAALVIIVVAIIVKVKSRLILLLLVLLLLLLELRREHIVEGRQNIVRQDQLEFSHFKKQFFDVRESDADFFAWIALSQLYFEDVVHKRGKSELLGLIKLLLLLLLLVIAFKLSDAALFFALDLGLHDSIFTELRF